MVIDGYYNHQLVKINVQDDKIKIGTKIINSKDIYAIHQEYITDYNVMYPSAVVVTLVIVTTLLSIILLSKLNVIIFVLSVLLGLSYTYLVYKPKLRKASHDDYSIIYDIIFKDTHLSIILKDEDAKKININTTKHNYWQRQILSKYIRRVRSSRKYLFTQIETGKWSQFDELYEKYSAVSKMKYGFDDNSLSSKQVSVLFKSYQKVTSKYVKTGIKLTRFSIMMIFILVIYLFFNKDLIF